MRVESSETQMLRLGDRIRLTRKEAERLELVTGFDPRGVRTLDDLKRYVGQAKAYYEEDSSDYRLLERLIDQEVSHCLRA